MDGTTSASDAFGTRIQLQSILGTKIDEKIGGSSYSSQNSHRLHFGLGTSTIVEDVFVFWPDGAIDHYLELAVNEVHTLVQGANPSMDISQIKKVNVQVYPNPFQNEFNVQANDPAITHFEIFNMNGVRVFANEIRSYSELIKIHADLANGSYVLRLMNGNNVVNSQQIIKN